MSFRAGDHVHHGPSGENWVLATDEESGEVFAAGWPETLAKAADCTILKVATDAEHLDMLTRVAASRGDYGQRSMRSSRAARQLEATV